MEGGDDSEGDSNCGPVVAGTVAPGAGTFTVSGEDGYTLETVAGDEARADGVWCSHEDESEGDNQWAQMMGMCGLSGTPPPPPAQIQATVTYAIDITTITAPNGMPTRSFETAFKETILVALESKCATCPFEWRDINDWRGEEWNSDVTINSITAGSVVVSFIRHLNSTEPAGPRPCHAFFYGAQLRTNIAGRCLAGRLHRHRAGTRTVHGACPGHRPGTA